MALAHQLARDVSNMRRAAADHRTAVSVHVHQVTSQRFSGDQTSKSAAGFDPARVLYLGGVDTPDP